MDSQRRGQVADSAPDGAQLPASPAAPLFRPQVLAERQSQWLGTVMLKPRAWHRWSALFAPAAALALLALLFFASYAKKAHVRGYLVPDQGMARVFALCT